MSLHAALLLGNCPRVLMVVRSLPCTTSIPLVQQITRRILGGIGKNGIRRSQVRRQAAVTLGLHRLPPGAALKVVQRLLGGCGAGCGARGTQRSRQQLAVLSACVVQADADQVHGAGLQRGGREHRAKGLADALEPVGHGDRACRPCHASSGR